MKLNRMLLITVAFLFVGLVLSRAWSRSATSTQGESAISDSTAMTNTEGQPEIRIAAAQGPVLLEAEQTRVSLNPAAGATPVRESLVGRRVYLIFREMSASEQPGVPYQVFFDLPPGANADTSSPYYVGVITFFNAVRLEGGEPASKDPRFFSFDITKVVTHLKAKKLLPEDITVTIKAGGVASAAAQPRIGRLEILGE